MATMQRSKLRQSMQTWKTKAIRRGRQLKQVNKRVRELEQSRDQWKRKAQTRHTQLVALQDEVQRLRHRLGTAEKNHMTVPVDMPTAFLLSRR